MRDNKVKASAWRGDFCDTAPVWQYDTGLTLVIEGVQLPETYEVHFGASRDGSTVTVAGTAEGAAIPDALLETGLPVYAWLYLRGENDGQTVKAITIPVTRRGQLPAPDPEPGPEETEPEGA